VLNKRIARPQVLQQYSARSLPFFDTFYILSGEFNASLMHSCALGKEARPLQNAPFCPIPASGSNFNPRNTQCIPVVKIFAFLGLEQN